MQTALRVALITAFIWTAACSQGGSLVLQNRAVNSGPPLTGQEFVSAATQNSESTGAAGSGKYHVQSAVGVMLPQTQQDSVQGYRLYSSGQGIMDSFAK